MHKQNGCVQFSSETGTQKVWYEKVLKVFERRKLRKMYRQEARTMTGVRDAELDKLTEECGWIFKSSANKVILDMSRKY